MAPLIYEKVPPTPDDVKLEPSFVSAIEHGDSDDEMVIFTIGQEDAQRFALDMERQSNGNRNLSEVHRGLIQAAEVLTGINKETYLKGVNYFIDRVRSQK